MARKLRGPWWLQPRDPGDRSREPGHVPEGALWRHSQIGPLAPHQLVGAGPQLGFILHFGPGIVPTRDGSVGEDEQVRPLGPPTRAPQIPQGSVPSAIPARPEPAVSMETAAGSARPGGAPLPAQAQFAIR